MQAGKRERDAVSSPEKRRGTGILAREFGVAWASLPMIAGQARGTFAARSAVHGQGCPCHADQAASPSAGETPAPLRALSTF
ncbi:hypothetical protein OPIT5_08725 [Opitutaceae bacterium TAV5]|nr:hypothetical protein OPIT5_08725 [Opitutaceae bacterium TAV5]